MQQDKDFEDVKFRCETHPQNSYRALCYAENFPHKRRLLCLECILEAKDKENIISFSKFFQDPIEVLDQNSEYFKFTQNNTCGNMITIIDIIETQINQLHQKLIDQLRKLKDEFNNISNQNREQLIQRMKVQEFQQQLKKVWNMDSYQGTEEFKVLEKQLNDLIVNWKTISQEYLKETANNQQKDLIIQDLTMKLIDYRYQYTSQQQLIFQQQQIPIEQLDFVWKFQVDLKKFVHQEISKGKLIKYELIYQGTRDGLTNVNYWQKCYSPCQLILKDTGAYWAVDTTNFSFIFQQNKQEIYRLKNNQCTIVCSKDYGPGLGGDFQVRSDFKSLVSFLGSHYDLAGYNVQNHQTHLIGDKDIEIVECKVYKIRFL